MSGKLFVIESGVDGSGKATQTELLFKRLLKRGYKVKKVTFPNYNSEASSLIKMYLNGEFGQSPFDVSPYIASTFYTSDRFASFKTEWEDFYLSGGIIICDRYTTSNMVHQMAKIEDEKEKNSFLNWLWEYEFEIFKLPVPDAVFFLDVNPELSHKLRTERLNKFTGEDKKDIHEMNLEYLRKCYDNSKYLVSKYQWIIIECIENSKLKSIDSINELLFKKINDLLK